MSHDPRPIGVFDSGVGGLTVARAIRAALPHEPLIYLGDTARVPYGNRSPETIRRYATNATHLLLERDVKAVVIACNTASAHGLDALLERFPSLPILGVIEPVARAAAARTENGHVGVIGTRATITSACYPQALRAERDDLRVTQLACPLFVPLAEEGWTQGQVAETVAREYLQKLRDKDLDTLILGCTHYPLLQATIGAVLDEVMDHYVTLIDSAHATALALEALLDERGLRAPHGDDARASLELLVTDAPGGFMKGAVRFFGGSLARPEHVDIVDAGDAP